jgi:hypothetical protein
MPLILATLGGSDWEDLAKKICEIPFQSQLHVCLVDF